MVSGSVGGQVASLLLMPVWATFYDVEDVGNYALITAYFAVLAPLVLFRLETRVLLDGNCLNDDSSYVTVLLFTAIFFSFVTYIGVVYSGVMVSPIYFVIFFFIFIASGLALIGRNFALKTSRFHKIAKLNFLKPFVSALGKVVLGFMGSFGLVIADLFGFLTSLIVYPDVKKEIGALRLKKIPLSFFKRHREHICWESLSVLLNSLVTNLPMILVVYLYGAEKGGLFWFAYRVVSVPTSFISSSVADKLASSYSEHIVNKEKKVLLDIFYSYLFKSSMASIILFFGISISAEYVLHMFFSDVWSAALETIYWLCMWRSLAFVSQSVGRSFYLIGAQKLRLFLDFIMALGVVLLFCLSLGEGYGYEEFLSRLVVMNALLYTAFIYINMTAVRAYIRL